MENISPARNSCGTDRVYIQTHLICSFSWSIVRVDKTTCPTWIINLFSGYFSLEYVISSLTQGYCGCVCPCNHYKAKEIYPTLNSLIGCILCFRRIRVCRNIIFCMRSIWLEKSVPCYILFDIVLNQRKCG